MNPTELFSELRGEWTATIALVILVLVSRHLLVRFVRRGEAEADTKRRWLAQLRTAAGLALLFGLLVIWAEELRTVALSLVAVAVALTIATKELILCLSGSLLRAAARAYAIGDRVQVGGVRGDVIDIGALSTRLLEVDDATHRRTGRSITIPNSQLLDKVVLNESFAGSYMLNVITVPVENGARWHEHESLLLAAAAAECREFLEDARAHIMQVSVAEGLDAPIVDPSVSLVLDSPEKMLLTLRFPTPIRRSNRVGQAILRRYLEAAEKLHSQEPPSDSE